MATLELHDADDLDDIARLEKARVLMQWAGYYLAHVKPSRLSTRARFDLSSAQEITREALATVQHDLEERGQLDLL